MKKTNFTNRKHKRITLLGMSGVGKTHLSTLLRKQGDWFHYSGDYRIGSRYLDEVIVDNIKFQMMQDPFLSHLLLTDSIYINHNISFDNLLPVSSFLGMLGNPDEEGLPFDEFKKRQKLYHDAEIRAMSDVSEFINKAQKIYHYPHFINDTTGSLCVLDNCADIVKKLAENTLVVYLKANKESEQRLINNAIKAPKPLYYSPDFLTDVVDEYLTENKLSYVAQINPNHFSRWVFPKLFYHRIPKYEALATEYGITIESEKVIKCQCPQDFFNLIESALQTK